MLAYDQLLGEGIRRRGRARERWRRSGVLLGYGPLSKRESRRGIDRLARRSIELRSRAAG